MTIILPTKCRYCANDADCFLEGWRHGPPDDLRGTPDKRIATCGLHEATARLKLQSIGYPFRTRFDINAWSADGGNGERRKDR